MSTDHSDRSGRRERLRSWTTAISAAGLALISYIALFAMESTTANFDPEFMRLLVERTAKYGGSYYSNGIHNKGPLEPFIYSLALHIGGENGFWFVIGCFTFVAAWAVGLAGAAVVIVDHGNRLIMACVMAIIITHLTVSDADYAGVLYSRNISVALLSVSFFVGVIDAAWATRWRRNISVVVVGGAIGLAVQTLISGVFTAAAVLVWVMWWRRRDRAWRLPVWVSLMVVAGVVFVSAPLYYRVFGPWDDFVGGFWTHARFMSEGTGRGLLNQFGLGWISLSRYYSQRPELMLPLMAWGLMVVVEWRHASPAQRSMRVMLSAWWGGACVELVLSQRYSSHYFSVLAVPTMLMLADLSTRIVQLIGRRFSVPAGLSGDLRLLPLLCAIALIASEEHISVDQGIQAAAMVHSVDQFAERRLEYQAPRFATTQAALGLISEDGDPLLMWTNYPWPYLDVDRVPATRYIWKSFLIGEIYLGATSEKFVLPGTWENFAADLQESDPLAFLVEQHTPVKAGTPFAEYVDANFTPVYEDAEETLSFRNDIADQLFAAPTDGREVTLEAESTTNMCQRVDGIFQTGTTTVVELIGSGGEPLGRMAVTVQPDSLEVNVHRDQRIDIRNEVPVAANPPFTLIAGARSVVLIVGGNIVAALAAEPGATLSWPAVGVMPSATLSNSPPATGCG